jgi:hypothetical protein
LVWCQCCGVDARYVITDRVVNGAPVWVAQNGNRYPLMWRAGDGRTHIGKEASCAAGDKKGVMYNAERNPEALAPTQLPLHTWKSNKYATLGPQFTSAGGSGDSAGWVWVPDMHVTAVHGLDDAEPAMAAALRQLAALPGGQ